MKRFPKGSKTAFACILIAAAAVGSFQIGHNSRESYHQAYTLLSSRSKISRLEFMSAYQPNAQVTDLGERASGLDLGSMETFYRVLRAIRENYVERIETTQEKDMAYGALRGMLQSLNDANSRFLEPAQYDVVKDQMDGKFHGIGAVLAMRRIKEGSREITRLIVVTTMPGSPAEKAGLKAGDSIAYLDGKWVISYDPYAEVNKLAKLVRSNLADRSALARAYEAAEKKLSNATTAGKVADALTADVRKDFSLTVWRPGEKMPLRVKVSTEDTIVAPTSHRLLADGVGYLHVEFFTDGSAEKIAAALSDLAAQGATKLVLDLRGCPGGSQDAAMKAAAQIAPDQVLGLLLKAHGKEEILKLGKPENTTTWNRIVVLVDGSTAGVAEMVAAGLRDSARATLVGEATFGDAKHQILVMQKDGSAVVFTDGEYVTPKRQKFDEKGVSVSVKAPPTDGKEDSALGKALEILTATTPMIAEAPHA